jgi:protein-S-isoprenylcysteine O-methyltransferase Ste14
MISLKLSMVVIGYGIRFWVVWNNPGFNLLIVKPTGIYQKGLYKYIRHPAYLGSLIMCGGIFALCAGWSGGLPAWIVLLVLLTHTARHEEQMLIKEFPEYKDYMKRTGMLLPKLRRRC